MTHPSFYPTNSIPATRKSTSSVRSNLGQLERIGRKRLYPNDYSANPIIILSPQVSYIIFEALKR